VAPAAGWRRLDDESNLQIAGSNERYTSMLQLTTIVFSMIQYERIEWSGCCHKNQHCQGDPQLQIYSTGTTTEIFF
jgi:hypothetical protein